MTSNGVPGQVRAERALKAMRLTAGLQVRVLPGYPVVSCIEKNLVEPRKRFTIMHRRPTTVVGEHQMGNPELLASFGRGQDET